MRRLAYHEAKLEALRELMEEDDRVHLIGGTFFSLSPHRLNFTAIEKAYPDRVAAPPISELGFCGLATGAAMAGLRPVVDITTGSFLFEAWPQVCNEAANALYMSGGQVRVPVVFHMLHGLRGGGAAQHSGSPQAMLWNCPASRSCCRRPRATSRGCSSPRWPATTPPSSSTIPVFSTSRGPCRTQTTSPSDKPT